MVSYGCCGLGASIYGSFILNERTQLTSGNGIRGLDNPGLRASTPIEISSGENLTLYRDTVGILFEQMMSPLASKSSWHREALFHLWTMNRVRLPLKIGLERESQY